MAERVHKILSQWGVASRRQAEQMILDGRVLVNGKVAQLGQQVDLQCDRLMVDGRPLVFQNRPQSVYCLINKPVGVVSTCADPEGRPTVLSLLPRHLQQGKGLHPVGRLDIASTGALLLTNDGEMTLRLTHPRYHLPKIYHVWLGGSLDAGDLDRWQQGIQLGSRRTLPAKVEVRRREGDRTLIQVELTEGRNRQIRRVAEQLGYPVLGLHRVAIGPLRLDVPGQPPLKKGEYRNLSQREINDLKHHLQLRSH